MLAGQGSVRTVLCVADCHLLVSSRGRRDTNPTCEGTAFVTLLSPQWPHPNAITLGVGCAHMNGAGTSPQSKQGPSVRSCTNCVLFPVPVTTSLPSPVSGRWEPLGRGSCLVYVSSMLNELLQTWQLKTNQLYDFVALWARNPARVSLA